MSESRKILTEESPKLMTGVQIFNQCHPKGVEHVTSGF